MGGIAECFLLPPQSRIAIVGASVRAAAQSALRAGYLPVVADLFADADVCDVCPATRITNYPDGFCDWLSKQDVDGWFYTGALENYPDLIDRMAAATDAAAPLWGNAGSVLRQVRSPLRLQQALAGAGLLFPETLVKRPNGTGDWLAKTYRGSSGCGVRRYKSSPEPQAAFFQRFVDGMPISALFVGLNDGCKLVGITKQLIDVAWTHAKPFQYAGSIGPLKASPQVHAEIERTGNALVREFNLVGLFGIDMILSNGRAWTLEVNPRYTAAVEVVERFAMKTGLTAGKAILFAPQPIDISEPFTDWAFERSRIKPWPEIGDVPTPGTQIDLGQPVLTVFAQGDCDDEVEHQLHALIGEAESRLFA